MLNHVAGNTYTIDVSAGTLVFYRTGPFEGILIDTGLAREDRDTLVYELEMNNARPIGIIVSHTHYDHSGNAEFLKRRYGCQIMASLAEAGTASRAMAYRCAYPAMTPKEIEELCQSAVKQSNEYKFSNEEIRKWQNVFYTRFFRQQFKRNCMPDGVKVGTVSVSPRGDLRLPAEVEFEELLV